MRPFTVNRRQLLASAGIAGLGAPLLGQDLPPAEPFPRNGREALERLKAGNHRFEHGQTRHAHQSAEWRKHLVGEQKPIATILGCSDSRVPPELVFDQGFGDLFVIRVAGNVIAADVVGSIAYAAVHLETPLFVVLGHAGCGAVTAAVDTRQKKVREPARIAALVKLIDPALKDVDFQLEHRALVAAAVEANVRWSLQQLRELPEMKPVHTAGQVTIMGGVYDLATGQVRFLDERS